ncbi:hypothetical protein HPT27_03615 [Permianibacter sp. IMCC34836]|uniref:hypothetical protein n=1 Tax=Permianibacter fluminis TaxID=2738515 RepID=UPI001552BCE5|nr:hypothetical protein [Permianibacter fluminis]NQD36098.1 hypothetical protein [Permianibacter fluminis]
MAGFATGRTGVLAAAELVAVVALAPVLLMGVLSAAVGAGVAQAVALSQPSNSNVPVRIILPTPCLYVKFRCMSIFEIIFETVFETVFAAIFKT